MKWERDIMIVRAYAKVNLALDIVGVMENGYHDLDMIMAPTSLYDEIEIVYSSQDKVECDTYAIPENNTVSKMIQLLKKEYSISSCFHVKIHKNIPMMSGMAGGSTDAAAVLKAIMKMEQLSISFEQQLSLAKQIGADVPFCVYSQWARVQGIGEIIKPIDTDLVLPCLLVKPEVGISTPVAFKKWHEQKPLSVDVNLIQETIEQKDISSLFKVMNNTLEPVAKEMEPILNAIQNDMEQCGIERVMMSGSGSTMMGFSKDISILEKAQKELEKKYNFVKLVSIGGRK